MTFDLTSRDTYAYFFVVVFFDFVNKFSPFICVTVSFIFMRKGKEKIVKPRIKKLICFFFYKFNIRKLVKFE